MDKRTQPMEAIIRGLDLEIANVIWVAIEALLPTKMILILPSVTDSVSQIGTASMSCESGWQQDVHLRMQSGSVVTRCRTPRYANEGTSG